MGFASLVSYPKVNHSMWLMISLVASNSLLWFLIIFSCMVVLYLLEVYCIKLIKLLLSMSTL